MSLSHTGNRLSADQRVRPAPRLLRRAHLASSRKQLCTPASTVGEYWAAAPSARTSAPHEMKDATELAVGVSSAGFEFDRGRRRYLL